MLSYTRLAHDANVAAIPVSPGDASRSIRPSSTSTTPRARSARRTCRRAPTPACCSTTCSRIADLEVARRAHDLAAWSADPEVAAQLAGKARERGVAERACRNAASIVYQTLTAPLALVDGTTLPPLMEAIAFARESSSGIQFRPFQASPLPGPAAWPGQGLHRRLGRVDDDLWCSTTRATCLPVTTSPRWRNAGCANAMPCRHGSTRSPRTGCGGSRRLAGFVRVHPPRRRRAGADRRGHARHVEHLAAQIAEPARPTRSAAHDVPAATPRHAARAVAGAPCADMFRRLGVGARSCDLGDEGLYLARSWSPPTDGSGAAIR